MEDIASRSSAAEERLLSEGVVSGLLLALWAKICKKVPACGLLLLALLLLELVVGLRVVKDVSWVALLLGIRIHVRLSLAEHGILLLRLLLHAVEDVVVGVLAHVGELLLEKVRGRIAGGLRLAEDVDCAAVGLGVVALLVVVVVDVPEGG